MKAKDAVGIAAPSAKLALSRAEAAQTLGISTVTLDRLTKRGLIYPSRATRRPMYWVREIERLLKETTSSKILVNSRA